MELVVTQFMLLVFFLPLITAVGIWNSTLNEKQGSLTFVAMLRAYRAQRKHMICMTRGGLTHL